LNQGKGNRASVEMRFNADAEARLAEVREFLEYEQRPGQRLFVTTIPTSLVHLDDAFETGDLVPPVIGRAGAEGLFQPLHKQRQQAFLRNVKQYGLTK